MKFNLSKNNSSINDPCYYPGYCYSPYGMYSYGNYHSSQKNINMELSIFERLKNWKDKKFQVINQTNCHSCKNCCCHNSCGENANNKTEIQINVNERADAQSNKIYPDLKVYQHNDTKCHCHDSIETVRSDNLNDHYHLNKEGFGDLNELIEAEVRQRIVNLGVNNYSQSIGCNCHNHKFN